MKSLKELTQWNGIIEKGCFFRVIQIDLNNIVFFFYASLLFTHGKTQHEYYKDDERYVFHIVSILWFQNLML